MEKVDKTSMTILEWLENFKKNTGLLTWNGIVTQYDYSKKHAVASKKMIKRTLAPVVKRLI